jgi:hypothetical protein
MGESRVDSNESPLYTDDHFSELEISMLTAEELEFLSRRTKYLKELVSWQSSLTSPES